MIKITKLINSALVGMSFKSSLDSCLNKIECTEFYTNEEKQI